MSSNRDDHDGPQPEKGGENEGGGDLSDLGEWDYLTRTFDHEDIFEDRKRFNTEREVPQECSGSGEITIEQAAVKQAALPTTHYMAGYINPATIHHQGSSLPAGNHQATDAFLPAHVAFPGPYMQHLGNRSPVIDQSTSVGSEQTALSQRLRMMSQQPMLMHPSDRRHQRQDEMLGRDGLSAAMTSNEYYKSQLSLEARVASEAQYFAELTHQDGQTNEQLQRQHPVEEWGIYGMRRATLETPVDEVLNQSPSSTSLFLNMRAASLHQETPSLRTATTASKTPSTMTARKPPPDVDRRGDSSIPLPPHGLLKPLTAYNYYYRDERDNIVQGLSAEGDPLPDPVRDISHSKFESLLHQHWYDCDHAWGDW